LNLFYLPSPLPVDYSTCLLSILTTSIPVNNQQYYRKTPKPEPNFLTVQKHDNAIGELDEDIVYDEEEDDIASGKKTTSKFMKGLKDKMITRNELMKPISQTKSRPISQPKRPSNAFPQRSSYGDIDLLGLEKFKPKPLQDGIFKSPLASHEKKSPRSKFKESLLAGLSPSLRNFQSSDRKSPKEEIKDAPKIEKQEVAEVNESPEPESLMIPNKNAR
jgi:hypothetical protein